MKAYVLSRLDENREERFISVASDGVITEAHSMDVHCLYQTDLDASMSLEYIKENYKELSTKQWKVQQVRVYSDLFL